MRSALPVLLLFSAACGDVSGAPTALVRDSAGIAIVENAGPAWGEGEGWTLSAAPTLEIGVADGDGAYLLDRVEGALRLPDGRIAIANARSAEIRFYDAAGTHLRTSGAPGDGPGEYRMIAWMAEFTGDSLLVYDQALRRLTVLTAAGDFGRTLQLGQLNGSSATPTAPFADGSLLARTSAMLGEPTSGPIKSDAAFARFSGIDGAPVDSLARLPGADGYINVTMQGSTIASIEITRPLLANDTHVAVRGDVAFLGYSGTPEIRVQGADGTLLRIIRPSARPAPVTEADLAALVAARLEGIADPARRKAVEQSIAKMPVPEVRPAFTGLLVDGEGNLWVRPSTLPGEPVTWTVFDPEGRELGGVEVPGDFRPMQIGTDYVLGVAQDELEVQRVRMYELGKGEG